MNPQSQVPDLEGALQVIVLEVPNEAVMAAPAFNIKRVMVNAEPGYRRLPDPSPVSLKRQRMSHSGRVRCQQKMSLYSSHPSDSVCEDFLMNSLRQKQVAHLFLSAFIWYKYLQFFIRQLQSLGLLTNFVIPCPHSGPGNTSRVVQQSLTHIWLC